MGLGSSPEGLGRQQELPLECNRAKNHPVKGNKFILQRGGAAVSPLSQKPPRAKGLASPKLVDCAPGVSFFS